MILISMKLLTFMILSHKFSIVVHRKSLEYLNSPKFKFVRLKKLGDLSSKLYEKLRN